MLTFDEFEKVDIRTGTVIDVEEFPQAKKPAYKLTIDFGKVVGIKKSSAQITEVYASKEMLLGKQVLAVVNFPPKQIGPFRSEVLTLGVRDAEGAIVLLTTDIRVPNGEKVH